jgi:murein DD-endopeptidase MepM/ murein hydrolase activator NlpD
MSVSSYRCFLKLALCLVALSVCSCSSSRVAPIEKKEQFYYGRDGTSRMVEVQRTQSLQELALSFGVHAEDLARSNNKLLSDRVHKGEVLSIPIDAGAPCCSSEEVDSQDYSVEIHETPLIEIPSVQEQAVVQDKDIEFELEKDLQSYREHKAAVAKEREKQDTVAPSTKQFIWPVRGKLLSQYGKSGSAFKEGISISAPLGAVVKAAADGEVVYLGHEPKVYGNLIIIKHKGNYFTAYAHCDKVSVKKSAKVKQGHAIGTVGKTGAVSKPQLYFSLRKDKKTVNPESFLAK